MSRTLSLTALALLTACEPEAVPPGGTPADTGPVDDTDAPPTDTEEPGAEPCIGEPRCLLEGHNAFESNGTSRDVVVELPLDPKGAPVIFLWHWLGASNDAMIGWMGTDLLTSAGYIVVLPQSQALASSEWDIYDSGVGNLDLVMFDELVSELERQYAIDSTRIHSMGYSAGGLFATWLTQWRGDVVDASAVFSGGVLGQYHTPATTLPVLVAWGGASDVYGPTNFQAASIAFADGLFADGHEVSLCDHGGGHDLPDDAQETILAFFDDHATDRFAWASDPGLVVPGCELMQ